MSMPNIVSSQRSIRLPKDLKERALRWVQSQASTAHRTPEDAPFKRLIDFWFAAMAWAVHRNIDPVVQASGEKFVSIGPKPQDVHFQQWKLNLLVLLALRDFGYEDEKAQNPASIVDLANRYAEAGASDLLKELETSKEFAIPMLYRVTDLFTDQFKQAIEGKPSLY